VLQLLVGWVQDNIFKKVESIEPVKVLREKSSSEQGYKFEHDELKRLMKRLKRFETVDFEDVQGNRLTPEIIDERFGPDGGIDCVIRIIAKTEQGTNNVTTRIRNILIDGDY
jgi:hypothetical protein